MAMRQGWLSCEYFAFMQAVTRLQRQAILSTSNAIAQNSVGGL
jgi:hypothetical protein